MNHRFAPPVVSLSSLIAAFLLTVSADAGTFQWANTSGNWNIGANWGGTAPSGADPTDVLSFGGDVAAPYTSTNNLPAIPSLVNQLVFNAADTGTTGNTELLNGSGIALGGDAPQISQNGVGAFTIDLPIELRAPLILTGNGGTVTMNYAISGAFDITKNGSSTFRFGTPFAAPTVGPSANKWMGRLIIDAGTIRFNNNAQSGRTALRANPVTLNSPTSVLTVSSELRTGVLNGTSGLVESRVTGTNTPNEDIVITTLADGTYDGTLRLAAGTGTGKSTGSLVVRGVGKQTLTGMFVSPDSPPGANGLQLQKDMVVGRSATLSLAGNASLAQQSSNAAVVMNGGTFQLDNSVVNNGNRLRNGDATSTGLETVGGGLFTLIGNAVTATSEIIARLQLGSSLDPRSGALTINVKHNAGTSAATELMLQSLSRDGTEPTFATVDFTAVDNAGTKIALGQSGNAPRISFLTAPLLANGLLRNTASGSNEATVGWATVNGSAFATHGATGIAPVGLVTAPTGGTPGNPAANIEVLGNFTISNSSGYAVNSLRLAPDADGESFDINTTGTLKTNAILLAGSRDYTISANGTGGLGGAAVGVVAAAARYVHVESATLTISARMDTAFLPLVKAGEGTLVLTSPSNVSLTTPTVINAGILRATPGSSLPAGELRFRGGVLEISGGGTFVRSIGRGSGSVNWSGIDNLNAAVSNDRGSGGFAAFGADAIIDLNATGASNIAWEDNGFLHSGHALMFGSRSADRRVTWSDNLNLSSAAVSPIDYNAREIRVTDNVASTTDSARVSGAVSGAVQNDLLKTGTGVLELTGANTYAGATLVHEGTLLVNSPGTIGNSFLTQVRTGATLAGNGTVGPVQVAIGGRLAPGSNVTDTGVLSSGSVTLDGPGAQFSIQLGGTVAGTTHDQLAVTGNIALNGGDLAGSLINGFAPAINDLFFIVLNKGTNPVSGTFAQGNLVIIDFLPFEIGYEGNSQSNTFTGGSDVVLRFIPEPATTGLVVGGLALLLLRRRRA